MDGIVPIKKVFKIINSCNNEKQLETCAKLADLYTQMIKRKGVINSSLVRETLYIRINEKKEELKISHRFDGKIRRRKIRVEKVERELVESFV